MTTSTRRLTELRLTITRTGAVRYGYWPRLMFRVLPLPRAEAEALIASGVATVFEVCDYYTGDGSPVRQSLITATDVN